MKRPGLYANIHAKRLRIKKGSGEKMRKPGAKGAPTAANFRRAAKTAKKYWQQIILSKLKPLDFLIISTTWIKRDIKTKRIRS